MTKRVRNRATYILILVILAVVLGVCFFSSDLKIQLFDLPALEAQKQPIIGMISTIRANDQLLKERHYPIRNITFCLWGNDSWTYKSSRTWAELVDAFDQSFVSWKKWPPQPNEFPADTTSYTSGLFEIVIYPQVGEANAGNTYTVSLSTEDPPDPRCSL